MDQVYELIMMYLVKDEMDERRLEEFKTLTVLLLLELDNEQIKMLKPLLVQKLGLLNDKSDEEDGGMEEEMEDFLGKIAYDVLLLLMNLWSVLLKL